MKQLYPYPYISKDEITDYNYTLEYLSKIVGKKVIDQQFGGNPYGGYVEYQITGILKTHSDEDDLNKIIAVSVSTDVGYVVDLFSHQLIYLIELGVHVNLWGWKISVKNRKLKKN